MSTQAEQRKMDKARVEAEIVNRVAARWKVIAQTDSVIDAECDTGSRVLVFRQRLMAGTARTVGGDNLITVYHPWKAAYAIQDDGALHWRYVVEKFVPGNERYIGDVYAVARAIAELMGRPLIGVPGLENQDD